LRARAMINSWLKTHSTQKPNSNWHWRVSSTDQGGGKRRDLGRWVLDQSAQGEPHRIIEIRRGETGAVQLQPCHDAVKKRAALFHWQLTGSGHDGG
jgi:hypothetical protein